MLLSRQQVNGGWMGLKTFAAMLRAGKKPRLAKGTQFTAVAKHKSNHPISHSGAES
jgi:hypothetical protein